MYTYNLIYCTNSRYFTSLMKMAAEASVKYKEVCSKRAIKEEMYNDSEERGSVCKVDKEEEFGGFCSRMVSNLYDSFYCSTS